MGDPSSIPGWEDPLEKGMATHSSVLAWRIPPWDFPGKCTGVGCYFLLQAIFPIQESNLGFLHCRQMLYPLSHQGSPRGSVKHRIKYKLLRFAFKAM